MSKCKHENKNGTCGLKGCYAYRHKCYTDDMCKCFEPITNADRIRAMSDEELAEFMTNPAPYQRSYDNATDKSRLLDWLRAEAKEEA